MNYDTLNFLFFPCNIVIIVTHKKIEDFSLIIGKNNPEYEFPDWA